MLPSTLCMSTLEPYSWQQIWHELLMWLLETEYIVTVLFRGEPGTPGTLLLEEMEKASCVGGRDEDQCGSPRLWVGGGWVGSKVLKNWDQHFCFLKNYYYFLRF